MRNLKNCALFLRICLIVSEVSDEIMGLDGQLRHHRLGVQKRLICILTDQPYVIINPRLEFVGNEMMELMDDCMSFPNLLVRVRRYRRCILHYLDENWKEQEMYLEDDMSELIQHEYDHLDGILATMRAIDNKSFVIKQ